MGLSVVVPCYNAADTVGEQLSALRRQEWTDEWEVVVVDNLSTDRTRQVVAAFARGWDALRIVDAVDVQSASHARNVGVRASLHSSIAVCDADDVVAPGWVAAMGEALRTHELVAGRVDVDSLNPAWLAASRGRPDDGIERFCGVFPRLPGCNLGFRRELWQRLGGYDESFSPREMVEDLDLGLRAWKAGVEPFCVPDAVVHYRYRRDLKGLWRQGRSYGRGRARMASALRQIGCSVPRFPGWRSWLWLLVKAPLAFTPNRFKAWVWVLANRLGHLEGSARYRLIHI